MGGVLVFLDGRAVGWMACNVSVGKNRDQELGISCYNKVIYGII